MINFDDYPNENETEHNLKWPYIPDHPYIIIILIIIIIIMIIIIIIIIIIIGGSGSGKTNALLNLINNQLDTDEIYLYAKDPCK